MSFTPERRDRPRKPAEKLLCHCGSLAIYVAKGRGFCSRHKEEAVSALKVNPSVVFAKKRHAEGRCATCGVPVAGAWYCPVCTDIRNDRERMKYAKRKSA